MKRFVIFVVFHHALYAECYEGLAPENMKRVCFFKVNEKIAVPDTSFCPPGIVREWELDCYNPFWQESGYNESSAIAHVYLNNLHEQYDYVGFCQYDMGLSDKTFELIDRRINESEEDLVFIKRTLQFDSKLLERDDLYNIANPPFYSFPLGFVIKSYEDYFREEGVRETLRQFGCLPLWSTFLISRKMFEELGGWSTKVMKEIYPWANEAPFGTHKGHLAGIMERVFGIFLALQVEKPTDFAQFLISSGLQQNPSHRELFGR